MAQSAASLKPAASSAYLGVERSFLGKKWRLRLTDERLGTALSQRLGLPEVVGRVLAARGVSLDAAPQFLNPTLRDLLPDPSRFHDMDAAASRLARAIAAGELIAIFGDYGEVPRQAEIRASFRFGTPPLLGRRGSRPRGIGRRPGERGDRHDPLGVRARTNRRYRRQVRRGPGPGFYRGRGVFLCRLRVPAREADPRRRDLDGGGGRFGGNVDRTRRVRSLRGGSRRGAGGGSRDLLVPVDGSEQQDGRNRLEGDPEPGEKRPRRLRPARGGIRTGFPVLRLDRREDACEQIRGRGIGRQDPQQLPHREE